MPKPLALQPGDLLGGKYKVEAPLGRGGMGEVYRATNTSIGREVAIKVLRPEGAADERLLARFRQEARTAAAIKHPGIVEIFDLSETDDGDPFIVMEYLEGETLGQRLDRGRIDDADEVVRLADAMLAALGAAHAAKILHRDLKPDNVFLIGADSGSPKLLDFGLSKLREKEVVDLSATGELLGTPMYMAPEQARGVNQLTDTIDLYAFGVILYYTLAGRPPFTGDTYAAILSAVLTVEATPLVDVRPELPQALSDLVAALMAKSPSDRPQSCREVREKLREILPEAGLPELETAEASSPRAHSKAPNIAMDPTLHSDAAAPTRVGRRRGLRFLLWFFGLGLAGMTALTLVYAMSHKAGQHPRGGRISSDAAPGGLSSVLRIGIQDAPGRFDPYALIGTPSEMVLDHVIERLLTLGPDGRPLPGPVASWTPSANGKEITLRLQPNLRFHDHPCFADGRGRQVAPRDVIYSLQLSVTKETFKLPVVGIDAFRDKRAKIITGARISDGRVVLSLEHATPFVGMWLSIVRLLPAELATCKHDKVHDMRQPVGTGPFRFTGPIDSDRISIERFVQHWRKPTGPSQVSGIRLSLVRSPQSAITRLRQRQLDVIMLAPGRTAGVIDESEPLQPKLGTRYASVPAMVGVETNVNYSQVLALIRYIGKPSPLHNPTVSRAISHGIDRAALVAGDRRGLIPLARPFSPELAGRSRSFQGFERDPKRAAALLAKAGFPGGKGLAEIVIAAQAKDAIVGKRLAKQLQALGIRIRTDVVMPSEMDRLRRTGPVHGIIASFGWHVIGTEPYPFGIGFLALARSAGKERPRLRALADKIERELDRRKRLVLYEELERTVAESFDTIPLGYAPAGSPTALLIVGTHVGGVVDELSGRLLHPGFEFFSQAAIRAQ